MFNIGDRLKDYWDSQGLVSVPGLEESDISAFESRYDVYLPVDMREYFSTLNGIENIGSYDNDMFSIWPLDLIRPLLQEFPGSTTEEHHDFFLFADQLIWAPAFAIKMSREQSTSNEVINVWDRGIVGRRVGHSFEEFVDTYIRDPFLLH